MTGKTHTFDDLIEEATTHYVRLQGAPKSRRYRKALLNWIAQSDEHAKAMDLVCRLWGASKAVSPPLCSHRIRRRRSPARPCGYVLNGGLGVLAASFCALLLMGSIHHEYITDNYQTANISTLDGVKIALGPRTSIAIDESFFARSIHLNQGVADIKVRPSFRALHTYLRQWQINDIGTRFVISNDANHGSVTLISGSIAIVDPRTGRELSRLAPRDMITWTGLRDPHKVTLRDTFQALAWEDHVIEFQDTPLTDALEQLYNFTGVNVSLRGKAVSSLKISGTFSYDHPDVLFRSIKTIYDVDVTKINSKSYVIKK